MDNILDSPDKEALSLPVYYNKVGGVFTTPIIYIGPILMVVGFMMSLFSVFGTLLFIACIPLFFSSSWVVIDLNKKQMYEFWTIYGLRVGSWKPIPPIRAVSVVRVKRTQTMRLPVIATPSVNYSDYAYKIKLILAEERKALDVLDVESRDRALEVGTSIALSFKVEFRDYSTPSAASIKRRR